MSKGSIQMPDSRCNLVTALTQVATDFSKRGISGITALNNKDFTSTAFRSPVRG
jgi:hypothetical protein